MLLNLSTFHKTGLKFAIASFGFAALFAPTHMLGATTEETAPITAPKHSLLKEMSKEFAQIAKKALPAVVSVRTQYTQRSQSQGQEDQNQPFPDDFFEPFF